MAGGRRPATNLQQLQKQLKEANTQLETSQQQRIQNATALAEAQRALQEQANALVAAQAELAAARAQAEATAAATRLATQAATGPSQGTGSQRTSEPQIPRPRVPRGGTLKIRQSMGIDEDLYIAIRYKIRTLVHSAQLSWQLDFRHQEVDRLAKVFNGAAKAYPILKRYSHHWATAAIAARYMQNVRRRARNNGHLPKRARHNRGGSQRERSSSTRSGQDGSGSGSGGEESD
ncbi:hypothetical protein BC628DRAFT_1416005 [Trametes gibbosa]|nr:hypothetical protein BC628DRAFT_1416005 [Trametes gibbosa]